MLHALISFAIVAFAVLLTAKIVPGIKVRSFGSAFVFAVVVALLNWAIGWLLFVLALPLVIVTLGLLLFVLQLIINAILWLLADKLVDGVQLSGFGAALLGSIVTSIISSGITMLLHHAG